MKKIVIGVVGTVIVLIAGILFAASRQPDTFRVERHVMVRAPAEEIFALVNDFRAWDAWTPYNRDPAMKKTYGGAPAGAGATYAWEGNGDVGKGEVAITAAQAPERIDLDLHMVAPFEARNKVTFTFLREASQTAVSWSMVGNNNLIGKAMGLFMDMDKMVGGDFETGLARLKAAAEKAAAGKAAAAPAADSAAGTAAEAPKPPAK